MTSEDYKLPGHVRFCLMGSPESRTAEGRLEDRSSGVEQQEQPVSESHSGETCGYGQNFNGAREELCAVGHHELSDIIYYRKGPL